MKKTLKILGLSIAILAGLLIAAAITISLMFNPNRHKGEIIRLVKEKTGRELKIEKNIGWSFFPRLGVEAGGLELSNAPGFGQEPFARIEAAGVHVELLPLFIGRIAVDSVYLHGLNLNLGKNTAGRNNWEDMLGRTAGTQPDAAPASGTTALTGFSIRRLELRRANLKWQDASAGGTVVVRNLELATGRLVPGQPTDLQLSFDLARSGSAPIKTALVTQLTAAPDLFKLSKLDLKMDDSRLTGSMDIQNFASPVVRFDLTLDRIDLDRYIGTEASTAQNAQTTTAAAVSPNMKPARPVNMPLAGLRSLDAKGKFRIQEFKAFGLRLHEAQIQLAAKNGLVNIGPNRAKLYGGTYQGESVLDVRGPQPLIRLDEKFEQVQVGPLLKDLQMFKRYSGTGNIGLKLTAQGTEAMQFKKRLNGNVEIALRDGRIEGMDLAKLIEQARALSAAARGKPVTTQPVASDATVFKSLTAKLRVLNGVAQNDDLVLDGPNLRATGHGSTDLVNEKLDYRLKVTVAGSAEQRGTTLPVSISGSFSKPVYRVEAGELIKQEAQKEVGKQIRKGLEKLFQPKSGN